jgi:hypothetical protein
MYYNGHLTVKEYISMKRIINAQFENLDSLELGILTMDDELYTLKELFDNFININRIKRIWSNKLNIVIYDHEKGFLV